MPRPACISTPSATLAPAFRDRLRAEPATAATFGQEKTRYAALNPDDGAAYTACKDGMAGRRSGAGGGGGGMGVSGA